MCLVPCIAGISWGHLVILFFFPFVCRKVGGLPFTSADTFDTALRYEQYMIYYFVFHTFPDRGSLVTQYSASFAGFVFTWLEVEIECIVEYYKVRYSPESAIWIG